MEGNVTRLHPLTDDQALADLRQQGQLRTTLTALGQRWGWDRRKVRTRLDRWQAAGHVVRTVLPGGASTIVATPTKLSVRGAEMRSGPAATIPSVVSRHAAVLPAGPPPMTTASNTSEAPSEHQRPQHREAVLEADSQRFDVSREPHRGEQITLHVDLAVHVCERETQRIRPQHQLAEASP